MSEETVTSMAEGQLYLFTEGQSPRKVINLGGIKHPGREGGNLGSFGRPGDHEYIEVLVEYTAAETRDANAFKRVRAHHHQIVRKEKISSLN